MKPQIKTMNQLTNEVMKSLYINFGPYDTLRFLSQFFGEKNNYIEERKILFKEFNLEDFNKEINFLYNEGKV